jgi:hypothetical protein
VKKLKRRESIKNLKLKDKSELKRIKYIIYQVGLERGESSAKKVFQVLELWQRRGWILSWGENPKWRYHDYILHQDGWFISLDGETVDFQIKSSLKAARAHLEKYPNVRVIVVSSGVSIEELNYQMKKLFKDKLPLKF